KSPCFCSEPMGPPASEFQITPVVLNNTINPGDGIRGTLGVGVRGIESSLDKFLSAVAESYWRIKSEQTLDSPCGNPSGWPDVPLNSKAHLCLLLLPCVAPKCPWSVYLAFYRCPV